MWALMFGPIVALLDKVAGAGGDIVKGWQTRLTEKAEAQHALEKAETDAKIAHFAKAQDAEINWDLIGIQGMSTSWKDEYLLILFSIPVVMCFIPGLDLYVERGFMALQATPDWFQVSFGLIVSASYGFQKLVNWQMRRKGGDTPEGS